MLCGVHYRTRADKTIDFDQEEYTKKIDVQDLNPDHTLRKSEDALRLNPMWENDSVEPMVPFSG